MPRVLFALAAALLSALLGALFNHGLELVIHWQQQAQWLVFLLPVVLIVTQMSESRLFQMNQEHSSQDNRFHLSSETLAGFLTGPLTWLSHLCGASVGREGVAIRLGRSVAEALSQVPVFVKLGLSGALVLRVGSAAGFAAVFGTPFASIVFAYEAFGAKADTVLDDAGSTPKGGTSFFCVSIAAVLSHFFAEHLFFVTHPHWIVESFELSWKLFVFLFSLSLAFYWFATVHIKLLKFLSACFARLSVRRRASFFALVFVFSFLLFTPFFASHRNLGSHFLNSLFSMPAETVAASVWDWFFKWLATLASVAFGFKGGEVTPLLAIGSLLSFALSALLGVSAKPIAVAGFSGLFAAVLRVPLTGAVLALEVFGVSGWPAAFVCALLLLWSWCWDRRLMDGAH